MDTEKLKEIFISCYYNCEDEEKIVIYNEYVKGGNGGNEIFENNKLFFNDHFSSKDEIDNAIANGRYNDVDYFVSLNNDGILVSGDYAEDFIVDKDIINKMAEWFLTHYDDINIFGNMSEFIYACENGICYDEYDEDDF